MSNLLKLHWRFLCTRLCWVRRGGYSFCEGQCPLCYCFAVCLEAPSDGSGEHHVLLLCGLEPSSSQHTMITYHTTPHSEIANQIPWCDPWIFLTNPVSVLCPKHWVIFLLHSSLASSHNITPIALRIVSLQLRCSNYPLIWKSILNWTKDYFRP